MATPATLQPRTWGPALVKRMRRLRLDRVQAGVLPWVILCWLLAAAVIVALLWPGALAGIAGEPVAAADGLSGFAAPGWFRLLVALAGAVLAGAAVVVVTRMPPAAHARRTTRLLDEVTVAAAVVVPVLLLLADHAWLFAVSAALLAIAAELLLRIRSPRTLRAVAAAGTWLVLLAYQFTEPGAARESWVWIALFGFAAAFAAFGAYYGVARAAESRSRALGFLFRRRWHPLAVLATVLVAVGLVTLRLTVLNGLFPDPDPQLWSPWGRPPVSWLLAALVAGVLVAVAIASTRRPLLRVGQRRVTAGLAVLGNLHLVVGALLILIGLVTAVAGHAAVPEGWSAAVPVLKVAGVAALGIVVLLPVFRGTAARWLVIVAVLFLLPNTLATALGDETGFPPSPVQVALLLVATAVVLAVLNLVRPTVQPSLVARLAAIPVIAVHAGWLLPAVWTQFGLVVAVAGLLIALVLLQPPAARDNATHSARVLTAAALQLLGLGVTMVAVPSLLDDPQLVVLGLVWLSVVVVAALCFETKERQPRPAPSEREA